MNTFLFFRRDLYSGSNCARIHQHMQSKFRDLNMNSNISNDLSCSTCTLKRCTLTRQETWTHLWLFYFCIYLSVFQSCWWERLTAVLFCPCRRQKRAGWVCVCVYIRSADVVRSVCVGRFLSCLASILFPPHLYADSSLRETHHWWQINHFDCPEEPLIFFRRNTSLPTFFKIAQATNQK